MVTKKQKEYAWDNASTIKGKNPDTRRKDSFWNVMRYGSYWTTWEYWREVDHKHPKAKWWTDDLRNIQALNWEKNREKSDKY